MNTTAAAPIAPHTVQYNLDPTAALVIGYPRSKGQAEIHRAGCSHSLRDSRRGEVVDFTGTLGDDWLDVAPCARVAGPAAKVCTSCDETFSSARALAAHNAEIACSR
jgi:hypothetical protein